MSSDSCAFVDSSVRRVGAALEELVGDAADEDDGAHHGQIERGGDAEQVDEVLQDLEQRRADDDADDRALSPAQTTAAEDRGGDAVELEEVSV